MMFDESQAKAAVRSMIALTGDNSDRAGVLDTPDRVVKSYGEMFAGYGQDPEDILSKQFDMTDGDDPDVDYQGMVILRSFEFYSTCEHHMLPFFGKASVGYIPGDSGKVVGLSKLARLVDCFSRRLQCQERITTQVVNALMEHLEANGAICVLEATHFCMVARGVQKQNAIMTTSEVRGIFKEDAEARAEALGIIRG